MRLAQPDNDNPNAKTIEEWSIIKGVKILDPDGFDRTDEKLYTNKYTEEEFVAGMFLSTCMVRF